MDEIPPSPGRPPLSDDFIREFRVEVVDSLRQMLPASRKDLVEAMADQIVRGLKDLNETWGPDRPCPYCGNPSWEIGFPVQLQVRPFVSADSALEPPILSPPLYLVTCTNCGNTVFVRKQTFGPGEQQ